MLRALRVLRVLRVLAARRVLATSDARRHRGDLVAHRSEALTRRLHVHPGTDRDQDGEDEADPGPDRATDELAAGLVDEADDRETRISAASAAVIIAGVSPISTLMFASRIACQTISDRSRPAISRPHPHADARVAGECLDGSAPARLIQPGEERDDEERDGAPSTTFAPCVSSESLSILRLFPFFRGAATLAFLRFI